tara:strand:- start:520 stop:1923 length:1404 start_codon:yes stop_codon:yes gene_type:complete
VKIVISFGLGIKIYDSLPQTIQGIIGKILAPIPLSWRGHRGVFNLAERISEPITIDELNQKESEALSELVRHAYENVPYYRDLFSEKKIDPRDVRCITDLKNLPILTKSDVRKNGSELIASDAKKYSPGKVRTSGSTGEPLEFLIDQRTRLSEYAAEWRCILENDGEIGGKTATFRGNYYRNHRKVGASWFRHALSGDLIFNTFSMDEETCRKYISKLRSFEPEIFRAFPSSLSHLARFVDGGKINEHAIAFCSSEMMSKEMEDLIQTRICNTVINWYSQSEYVLSAGTCREGNMHINSEFGIIEVLDEEGKPVPDGTVGRLVGTSLTNFSQPFIRYDLDDLGAISETRCKCGRPHRILQRISGRHSDLIVTPDDRTLSTVQMQHWWKHQAVKEWDLDHFDWIQLIQTDICSFRILVVSKSGVESQNYHENMEMALSDLWGTEVSVSIQDLDTMPHGEKWRFSKSEI